MKREKKYGVGILISSSGRVEWGRPEQTHCFRAALSNFIFGPLLDGNGHSTDFIRILSAGL